MAATSSSSIKSSTKPGAENEWNAVLMQLDVPEPVTAKSSVPSVRVLASMQVSTVPTKTEDGGSLKATNATGRDAFMIYSNDNARSAAMLDQSADAGKEGRGVDPEVNRPTVRKTRLSFELHPDEFLLDMTE